MKDTNKIEVWLKKHGYELYEVQPKRSGVRANRYKYLCAIKESTVLFIDVKRKTFLQKMDWLIMNNSFEKPVGIKIDSFENFERNMKELKLWIY